MALNDVLNLFKGKKQPNELTKKNEVIDSLLSSENFPVIQKSEVDMSKYRKIPWTGIAALGAAFSMLPESARTIQQNIITHIAMDQPLFIELNPKNVQGFQRYFDYGTSGRIWRVNEQGKQVLAGTKYYKQITDGLPITQTAASVIPFDPMTMVIAAAIMNLDKKLDAIQAKVDEVLQYLKSDKQSKQRGSLNMLVEILDDFKQNCTNDAICAAQSIKILDIKEQALQNILFYQEQIDKRLHQQRLIHVAKQADEFLSAVMGEFLEYQLSCYLYGFSTFLSVLIQKSFEETFLNSAIKKMEECAARYHELYSQCCEQISAYQQNAVETKLRGALGTAAKAMGKGIAAVPGLNKGPVDELLTLAGESLDEKNKTAAAQHLDKFAPLEDNRLHAFIENLHSVDLMYNHPNSMLMDDENLYILEAA